MTYIEKSIYGVYGTRTRGGRMEGADESTQLWRNPMNSIVMLTLNLIKTLAPSL